MSYHNLGLISERENNQREAESNLRKAADLAARLAEPRLKLAEIYRRQRRPELQHSVLREMIAGNPTSPAGYEALGQILIQGRQWEQAEQVYTEMLANGVNPAVALTGLGDAHAGMGDRTQAAEDYRQAMRRSTDPAAIRELQRKIQETERRR